MYLFSMGKTRKKWILVARMGVKPRHHQMSRQWWLKRIGYGVLTATYRKIAKRMVPKILLSQYVFTIISIWFRACFYMVVIRCKLPVSVSINVSRHYRCYMVSRSVDFSDRDGLMKNCSLWFGLPTPFLQWFYKILPKGIWFPMHII